MDHPHQRQYAGRSGRSCQVSQEAIRAPEASGAVINATNIANDIAVNKLISGSIIELDNISPLTGQALVFNGTKASWQNITAGGAGGSDTQLQFNQTGILQGSNRLIWDYNQNKFLKDAGGKYKFLTMVLA